MLSPIGEDVLLEVAGNRVQWNLILFCLQKKRPENRVTSSFQLVQIEGRPLPVVASLSVPARLLDSTYGPLARLLLY